MSEWLDADGDPLPDAMELKPDRLRWLMVFLISAGFVAIAVCALVGCGGGAPLLHPARTLPSGEVRVAGSALVPGGAAKNRAALKAIRTSA